MGLEAYWFGLDEYTWMVNRYLLPGPGARNCAATGIPPYPCSTTSLFFQVLFVTYSPMTENPLL